MRTSFLACIPTTAFSEANNCLNNGGCDSKRKCTSREDGYICGPCPDGWTEYGAQGCRISMHVHICVQPCLAEINTITITPCFRSEAAKIWVDTDLAASNLCNGCYFTEGACVYTTWEGYATINGKSSGSSSPVTREDARISVAYCEKQVDDNACPAIGVASNNGRCYCARAGGDCGKLPTDMYFFDQAEGTLMCAHVYVYTYGAGACLCFRSSLL